RWCCCRWVVVCFVLLCLPGSRVPPPRAHLTSDPANADPSRAHESPVYNYRCQYPPQSWKMDDRLKLDLHTNIAMRRTDPNSWLAILTTDFKTRTPQDAELVDEAERRLHAYFQEHLESEKKPDGELAGRRACKLEFVG